MYGPGGQRPANPGGREAWLRRLAAACLAAAVLTGTLAFTFAPGGSFLLDQGSQPGPPTNLKATPHGSSEVTFSWGPPTSNGGADIIFYDVSDGTGLPQRVPASDTSYPVAVTSGTTYTFQVSATNDDNYQSPGATVTYTASSQTTPPPSSQILTFGPLANQPMNTHFTVSATATSGLAVGFSSATPAACTVSDSRVFDQADVMTLTAGVCTIVATQAGNTDWAAATSVQQSFQVLSDQQTLIPQTLTFGPLANRPMNTHFTVSATATSGLAVGFSSATPAACTVSDSRVFDQADVMTLTAGVCTIVATQAGNTDWAAATSVQQSFQVLSDQQTLIPQTLTFGPLANRPMNTHFTVSATATSGLAVGFSSATPAACTVSDSRVFDQADVMTLTAGVCTIVATQAGNTDYALASDVTRLFQIGSVRSAGSLPLLIIVAAAVILAAAAAALVVRGRRLRSRPSPAPELGVRAVPHVGPPAVLHVQVTGTGPTHTVRIEPHPGAGITTIEKSRP